MIIYWINYFVHTISYIITLQLFHAFTCHNNKELVIKGNSQDLIEFADYIVSVALSENKNDHVHLDELSLIDENSEIKNLIIEK